MAAKRSHQLPWYCRENEEFIQRAKQLFIQSIDKTEFYELMDVPTAHISASSLTASRVQSMDNREIKDHFLIKEIEHQMKKQLKSPYYVDPLFNGARRG